MISPIWISWMTLWESELGNDESISQQLNALL